MRFTSLGSGSDGNALVVERSDGATTTRLLLDCGFSMKETSRRLERVGLAIDDLDAILITHEHTDHIGSALTICRKFGIPLHTSWGTAQAIGAVSASSCEDTIDAASAEEGDSGAMNTKAKSVGIDLQVLRCGVSIAIGDILVTPYTVPHDAREPLQFTFSDGASKLGILTDAGCGTAHISQMLAGCDALVLECNHDRAMLAGSRYHASLKARIGGNLGHLANDAAAQILATLEHGRLRHLVAAHLSKENNQAELAQAALSEVTGGQLSDIIVATQDGGFDWASL